MPGNARLDYVGSAWGEVWKTRDGGSHWRRVLYLNGHAGCSAIAFEPDNPELLEQRAGETCKFDVHT